MKFSTLLTALLATASTAIAADAAANAQEGYCGHKCDPSRTPKSPLSGDIQIVTQYDIKNPAIKYEIAGKVTIVNDCTFKVENFYMFPGVNVAKWMGVPTGSDKSIGLTKDGAVTAIDPNQPITKEYNVDEADDFCKASLLDNVAEFRLVDSNYQLLAKAIVNPEVTEQSSQASNQNDGKKTEAAGPSKTSDAKTSKWSMAFLGLSAIAGYLLAY